MKGNNRKRRKNNGRPTNRKPSNKQRLEESLDMTSKHDVTPDQRKLELLNAYNDPSWYAQNPQLLKDYASYPFGYPLGGQLDHSGSTFTGTIPGVMACRFTPSVGVATDETSPINVAMRKLYSFVRYANSGAKNYDAPDLMMYIVAVDSARMYLEFLKRAYGVFMNYTAFNRYYPRSIVYAMGIDFDDVESNLSDFRGFINQYAVKLNQLWVPSGFSYFKRHEWLCQHVYVDSATSPKAQTYFFVPQYFYKFTVTGNPAVGSLVCTPLSNQSNYRLTVQQMIEFGNSLLNPLITNEDIGIMAGDILKAYGQNGVLTTMGISEDYRVLPEYVPEVQSQLENMMFSRLRSAVDVNVTQNTSIGGGYLVSKPWVMVETINYGAGTTPAAANQTNIADALFEPITGSRFLNLHMPNPTPEDVIVATRDMFSIDETTVTFISGAAPNYPISASAALSSCGSEIFTDILIVSLNNQGLPVQTVLQSSATWIVNANTTVDGITTSITGLNSRYLVLEQFDWHPIVAINSMQRRDTEYSWSLNSLPFVDSDNFTFVDANNIYNMHMLALLSEFTVPMIT